MSVVASGQRSGPTRALDDALTNCAAAFATIASVDPHPSIVYAELRSTWTAYYTGPFAALDRAIRDCDDTAVRSRVLPVSIASHNLQRLFEVLGRDLGGATLATARVPERLIDLAAALARVDVELREAASVLADQGTARRHTPEKEI